MTYMHEQITQKELASRRFGPLPVIELLDVQAAWLAALVDGEGCIAVWKQRRAGGQQVKYNGVIVISNTCIDLLIKARELTRSGVLYLHRPGTKHRRTWHKPLYTLRINNRAVPAVLRAILPYLIAKRRQAELVLRFYEAVHAAPVRSAEEHAVFEYLYLESRRLNKRGKDALE